MIHVHKQGLQCDCGYIVSLLTDKAECTEGEVRLVDGAVESEGRVEMCVNGRWGTACADSSWDDTDAQTVCKQMGFESTYIQFNFLLHMSHLDRNSKT